MSRHPEEFGHGAIEGVVWGLIASLYLANVLLLILNVGFIPMFVRALRMPYTILMALIIVFCVTGAYAQSNKLWDVGQMLVFFTRPISAVLVVAALAAVAVPIVRALRGVLQRARPAPIA